MRSATDSTLLSSQLWFGFTRTACGSNRSPPRTRATSPTTSLRASSFPCVGDHVAQGVEIDGAGHDVFADDETGGAVNVERVGEREIGLERLLDLRRAHILLEPFDIEPYRPSYLIDRVVGYLTLGRHHCVMKGLIFALPLGRERGMRGRYRLRAEDRQFLVQEAQVVVFPEQGL